MSVRAVGAAGAALVMAASLSGCGNGSTKMTLHFTEKGTNHHGFLDNPPTAKLGPQGPDMLTDGDVITFGNDIVDASGTRIGTLDATCVDTRAGRHGQASVTCQGTYTLPKGQLFITAGGNAAIGSPTLTGAVVGGTGDYAAATGTFTSKGDQNSKVTTFNLFIPK